MPRKPCYWNDHQTLEHWTLITDYGSLNNQFLLHSCSRGGYYTNSYLQYSTRRWCMYVKQWHMLIDIDSLAWLQFSFTTTDKTGATTLRGRLIEPHREIFDSVPQLNSISNVLHYPNRSIRTRLFGELSGHRFHGLTWYAANNRQIVISLQCNIADKTQQRSQLRRWERAETSCDD